MAFVRTGYIALIETVKIQRPRPNFLCFELGDCDYCEDRIYHIPTDRPKRPGHYLVGWQETLRPRAGGSVLFYQLPANGVKSFHFGDHSIVWDI